MLHRVKQTIAPYLFALTAIASAGILSFFLEQWFLPSLGTLLLLQLAVIIVALRGDSVPALTVGVLGALMFNYGFTEPRYTFHMTEVDDIVNLLVFLIIAVVSSQMTIHFRSQRDALRHAQLQSSLLLSVSHDLRTPLATIIGTLSTLQAYQNRLSESERNELLNGAIEESHRLHRYVENLLQATKIQHQAVQLNPEPQSIVPILRRIIQRFDSPRLHFEHQTDLPAVWVRESLIEQALYNVIDNALAYSPKTEPVAIQVDRADTGTVRIQVQDRGAGIPPALRDKVFDPFFSTRSGDSGEGGTGLGLSVAAGLIHAHRGRIAIHNQEPGCTVTITLPTTGEPAP